MRKFSLTRAAVAVLLAVGLVACENKPATSTAAPTADSADKTPALATAYVCPMGCEGSASNEPGKCPVCDMALERNPDYKPAAQ